MAVLCSIKHMPEHLRPSKIFIFYAHFKEHSPDTFDFVMAGVQFAKANFKDVHFEWTDNSVIDFFDGKKMIPHPKYSPCTHVLKVLPIAEFMAKNNIDFDLVGYVRHEHKRIWGMIEKSNGMFSDGIIDIRGLKKSFPISDKDDQWCFDIVKMEIGWYPKIYDIKLKVRGKMKRIFSHNNCLPCKNMDEKQLKQVKKYYQEYYEKAMNLSNKIGAYWGRKDQGTCAVCEF